MKITPYVALSGLMCCLLCSAAHSRQIWTTNVGGWRVGAYTHDRSGQFSHCAAGVSYQSGIFLFFAIGRDFSWSMNLANNRWQLQDGSHHAIRFQVDRGPILNGTAKVNGSDMVEIELLDSAALFRVLKAGRTLAVEASGQTFSFDLTNSSKALDAAIRCTNTALASETNKVNPFASSSSVDANPFETPSAKEESASRVAAKTEAATMTANLLSAARIDQFTIVDSIPADLDFFDAMWIAPGVMGGLMVQPTETIDSALSNFAGRSSANCKGRHASAKLPGKGGVVSLKLMCDETASTVVMFPRSRGGLYIVIVLPVSPTSEESTLPSSEQQPSSTEAVSARIVEASYGILEALR